MTATGVDTEQVMAFRIAAHHLHERMREGSVPAAAGACGLQDTPPGSALLALNARVRGVRPETLVDAVEDRSLFHTWAMRGSPFFFPTADLAVFTAGVLPEAEKARLHLILGVEQALEQLDMGLDEAVERIRAALRDVLAGRQLAINELGAELARAIAGDLSAATRRRWEAEGPYAKGQPWGEAVVHFGLRILCLQRSVCFAHRDGKQLPFVRTDEWLGDPPARADPALARAEITRRYLRCYGPSTRAELAAWLGIGPGDAQPWWASVEDELGEVVLEGRSRWLLAADLDALSSPPAASGVRILPPRDPLLQLRDRETLVPDKGLRRQIWKTVGDPGTVLVDGRLAATWRPRKRGRTLQLSVQPFCPLPAAAREQIEAEAQAVAELRGATTVEVDIARDAGQP